MKTSFLSQVRVLLVAAVLPLVAATATTAAESPSLLLQKGIYAEEVERNLDSAIKIYEQIAAESAANRSVVAQAQYRLAVCYQKQGKKELAISTFNDVLKQFPSDVTLGQKAREALAQLGQTPSDDLKIRRLASVDGTPVGSVTPDGRFIIYQPSVRPMDRSIYEIATGRIWATLKGDPENTVRGVYFSPDGRRTSYRYAGVIYVVGIDGADPKPVYRMDKDTRAMPFGWSDDRTILVNWWSGEKWTNGTTKFVGKLDIETGVLKEIGRLPAHEEDWSWAVSSDGRYVALVVQHNPTGPTQLWALELNSGRVHSLVENEVNGLEGWFGANAVFTRQNDRVQEMWMIAVRDGKPAGEPNLVRSDLRTANLCGVIKDGSVYYSERPSPSASATTELWVIERFLATNAAPKNYLMGVGIREEIRAGENAVFDPKFGVSATVPSGWVIRGATQSISSYYGRRTIYLSIPGVAHSQVVMSYGPRTGFPAIAHSTPPSSDQIAAQLEEAACRRTAGAGKSNPDFKFRKGTLVARSIGNNWVFSGVADFTEKEKAWVMCFSLHLSETSRVSADLRVEPNDLDTTLPELRRLTDTIQLR